MAESHITRDAIAKGLDPRTTAGVPWRDHLTDEEREVIKAAEVAKAEWQRLNDRRAGIVNRAIQRAKYAQSKPGAPA